MKIVLLADLAEPLGSQAESEPVILAWEIFCALHQYAATVRTFSIDLVARRGTQVTVPLISIDPDEIPYDKDDKLAWFACQESIYCQLVLSGMLAEYDLVHCVAPIVVPLQMLASSGTPIVQTIITEHTHPSAYLPRFLIASQLLRQVVVTNAWSGPDDLEIVPLSVDLEEYKPGSGASPGSLLWIGTGSTNEESTAQSIGDYLGLPLEMVSGNTPPSVWQDAHALLYLNHEPSPCGAILPLRAMACGISVVGYHGAGLEAILGDSRDFGLLLPPGDKVGLAEAISQLSISPESMSKRRDRAVALYGRRTMASRYRHLYDGLVQA
jgi:hypothetical protein